MQNHGVQLGSDQGAYLLGDRLPGFLIDLALGLQVRIMPVHVDAADDIRDDGKNRDPYDIGVIIPEQEKAAEHHHIRERRDNHVDLTANIPSLVCR